MRWRDRFLFVAEAIYKSQAETGEVKGHYFPFRLVRKPYARLGWIQRTKRYGWKAEAEAKRIAETSRP